MKKSRGPWISIILIGLLAFVISTVVVAATIGGYAFALGMQARGAPDPDKIAAFANRVVPFAPLLLSLLVVLAARIVVRRAQSPQLWQGILLGVVAVLPTLMFMSHPGLADVVAFLLPPAAGWLGALWAMRSRKRQVEA